MCNNPILLDDNPNLNRALPVRAEYPRAPIAPIIVYPYTKQRPDLIHLPLLVGLALMAVFASALGFCVANHDAPLAVAG